MSLPQSDSPDTDAPIIYGPEFDDLDVPLGISRKISMRTVAPAGRVPDTYFHTWPTRTVLLRWRRRGIADGSGATFHGARLFPSLWTVLRLMHERQPHLHTLDAQALVAVQREALADDAFAHGPTTAMDGLSLHVLIEHLSRRNRLARLLDLEWPGPMVPDVLLYKSTNTRVHGVRFVTVLQRDASLWSDAVGDLRRLRAVGIRAGVWRFASNLKGSPATLRAARRRLMPTRAERRARQIRGYSPWTDVEACRGIAPKKPSGTAAQWRHELQVAGPPVAREACLGCGRPPAELEWVYFTSPSWMWARLCGRAGWLAICPDCQHQVDFHMTSMS